MGSFPETEIDPKILSQSDVTSRGQTTSAMHQNIHLSTLLFCIRSGPNAWRNCEKPFSILQKYCESTLKPFTLFEGKKENPDRIVIADREYTLAQFGQSRFVFILIYFYLFVYLFTFIKCSIVRGP